MDEVYTYGHGKLYENDGRTRHDPSKQYGSRGLLQGKQYMISVTWRYLPLLKLSMNLVISLMGEGLMVYLLFINHNNFLVYLSCLLYDQQRH